jgi:AcrR family transcriptional regulator
MRTTTRRPTRSALPRGGRHGLTQEAVSESQRQRMLLAVMQAVADKGFASTTVADVVTLAGVSRRTFYEHFTQIEDCFLAAYELGVSVLLDAVRAALRPLPRDDWRQRAAAAIDAYLLAMADSPSGAAWSYSIEVLGAGRKALAMRANVLSQWAGQWRALHELRLVHEPGVPAVDDDTLLGLVGGIEELVRECLRTRGARHLPEVAPAATRLALRVLDTARPVTATAPARAASRARRGTP